MYNFILKNKLYFIGAVIGGVLGFLYWRMIGCTSGNCMITSKPFNCTLYGGLMGSVLLSLFKK